MTEHRPFGNPDGARSEIRNILDTFIEFTHGHGISLKKSDLSARVLVGKKGSGKTVYLRRLQDSASEDQSLYVDHIQRNVPTTGSIVAFSEYHDLNTLDEKWTQAWHCAILRTVASHILFDEQTNKKCTKKQISDLRKTVHALGHKLTMPMSIYSQLKQIINSHHSEYSFNKYFEDYRWDELEAIIAEILASSRPIFFFIDSIDEEFARAPMFWLHCQLGLFYKTMRLLRDSRLGGRLHIVIAIRESVFARALHSEHGSRYIGESHIRLLDWGADSIVQFLHEKINSLDSEYLLKPGANDPVERWLGITEIRNHQRHITEKPQDYILRHTRLLPRDIIILGNRLCEEVRKAKMRNSTELSDQTFRSAVGANAEFYAMEQLRICANQIASNSMPSGAARNDILEIYTGDSPYVSGIQEDLLKFISEIGKEELNNSEFNQQCDRAVKIFGSGTDIFSVLWQNGLVGYREIIEKETYREAFFSLDVSGKFLLPKNKKNYIFHSIIIDITNIDPNGHLPVRGCPSEY